MAVDSSQMVNNKVPSEQFPHLADSEIVEENATRVTSFSFRPVVRLNSEQCTEPKSEAEVINGKNDVPVLLESA